MRKACGTIFGIELHAAADEPLCGLCLRRMTVASLEAERYGRPAIRPTLSSPEPAA